MTINNEQIDLLLTDLFNIHLVLLGISLTIFTLLYSFILNKRDELRVISEQIKREGLNPVLQEKESFAIKYIQRLKKINTGNIIIILFSSFLFTYSWIVLRFINTCSLYFRKISLIIILLLSLFTVIYLIIIFIKMYNHYEKETKMFS